MDKVCFEFENGKKINLELYREHAPLSVENFLDLVKSGFYDGLCFHRIIEGFMIQGGGFEWKNGLVNKEAPKTIKGEFISNGVNNTLKHEAGVISMARTMFPNSASSQFFICVDTHPYLDGQYAGFGKTCDEESLKVAIELSKVATTDVNGYADVPVEPVVIKKAYVIE